MQTIELVAALSEAGLPVDCLGLGVASVPLDMTSGDETPDSIILSHPEGRSEEDKQAAQAIADAWLASQLTAQQRADTLARHENEQVAGVTLSAGFAFGYSPAQRQNYHQAKDLCRDAVDLGQGEMTVTLWDVAGVSHEMSANEALALLREYTQTAAAELSRQLAELAALGW